jgi:hypothetical protein
VPNRVRSLKLRRSSDTIPFQYLSRRRLGVDLEDHVAKDYQSTPSYEYLITSHRVLQRDVSRQTDCQFAHARAIAFGDPSART